MNPIAPPLKTCKKCGETHDISFFQLVPANKDGRSGQCKNCRAAWRRKHYEANRERYREWVREQGHKKRRAQSEARAPRPWIEQSSSPYRRRVHRQYGLSPAAFDALVAAQLGRCAICRAELTQPHVDHDHTTGAVRGLLCQGCNTGIGHLRDSPEILAAAIRYLTQGQQE